MKLLLSSRSSSANGLLLFFSPRKRPWFQISAWLTKIWKCRRFSGTSGTGTSCDLRFNKCFWSIRWGMSSQLDICFLDCVLIALSYCSGGGEENTSAARYGGEPGVGELNASEGKSNKWIRSPSIYFDIPHYGLKLSPKLLSVISLQGGEQQPEDWYFLLAS